MGREDQSVLESVEGVEGAGEAPPWEGDSHPCHQAQQPQRNCHYCPLKIMKMIILKLNMLLQIGGNRKIHIT